MAKKEQAQAPAKKKKGQQEAAAFTEPARLRVRYAEEIAPAMHEKFNYPNPMMIPKLEKIVLNMGLGSDKDNPKLSTPRSSSSVRSPVRSPSSPRPRSPLRTSRCVRV